MTTSSIQRLEELLDEKDERIESLETQLRIEQDRVSSALAGWSLPREVADDHPTLPLPRFEMTWTPKREGDWRNYVVEYRLVYRHLCGHIVVTPMGSTSIGGSGRNPFEATNGYDLPFRDGAHIVHDAAHFGFPAYAITPSGAVLIEDESREHAWSKRGRDHRRSAL